MDRGLIGVVVRRVRQGTVPRSTLVWSGVSLILACTWGCGGDDGRVPVYPVTGSVSVAGEIPDGALIVFYPDKPEADPDLRPSAKVKPDGSFALTTYDAGDGAPEGEYTGTIQWNKLVKKGSDFVAGPDRVPKSYKDRSSSLWKLTVGTEAKVLEPLVIKK